MIIILWIMIIMVKLAIIIITFFPHFLFIFSY